MAHEQGPKPHGNVYKKTEQRPFFRRAHLSAVTLFAVSTLIVTGISIIDRQTNNEGVLSTQASHKILEETGIAVALVSLTMAIGTNAAGKRVKK